MSNKEKIDVLRKGMLSWIFKIISIAESCYHYDWFAIFKEAYKGGDLKSFNSCIGLSKNYWKVLDFIFQIYIEPKKFQKKHLLWFMNFIRENRSWNSHHASWDCSWKTYHGKVLEILEILDQEMHFIDWKLFLVDFIFSINGYNIFAAVDSTEMEIEKPQRNPKKTRKIIHFKLDNDFFHYNKHKKWKKDPTFSGKKQQHTLKYEFTTTLLIGFIIFLVGPVNGPIADQILARVHGLDEKIKAIGNELSKDIVYSVAGDGHYTNFKGVVDRTKFNNALQRYYFHALRTKVETFNSWIKHYKIMTNKYKQNRGDLDAKKNSHSKFTNVICQIQNLKRIIYYEFYRNKFSKKKNL